MPRVANPLTKVRKRLDSLCLDEVNMDALPKEPKPDKESHLSFYRKLTPIQREIIPKADEALDLACERLGLPREMVHGFVEADSAMNAGCYSNIRGNAVVTVNSGVVERLTMQELCYVMGHELGHYIMPMRLPRLKNGNPPSMEHAITARKLEICMDRFGLAACQDISVACSAALKIQSGLSSENLRIDVHAFGKEVVQGYVKDPQEYEVEARSSHPNTYVRLRALCLFAESDAFLKLQGKKGGRPVSEVNAEVISDLRNTLDYFAEKLMTEIVEAFTNHVAAMNLAYEGEVKSAYFEITPGVSLNKELVVELAGQLRAMAEDERKKAFMEKVEQLSIIAMQRCPSRMAKHLEGLSSSLSKTVLKDFAASLPEEFIKGLEKYHEA